MNKTLLALCAAGALSAAASAFGASPVSGVDRAYLTKDAEGSVYDQATAETAVQQATSPAIYKYAVMLVNDHNQLNLALLQMAHARGIALPITMLASDTPHLLRLTRLHGAAFDRAYIQEAIRINAEDVKDAQKEASATKDPQVKTLVTRFLATEQKHLQAAQDIKAQMSK